MQCEYLKKICADSLLSSPYLAELKKLKSLPKSPDDDDKDDDEGDQYDSDDESIDLVLYCVGIYDCR